MYLLKAPVRSTVFSIRESLQEGFPWRAPYNPKSYNNLKNRPDLLLSLLKTYPENILAFFKLFYLEMAHWLLTSSFPIDAAVSFRVI